MHQLKDFICRFVFVVPFLLVAGFGEGAIQAVQDRTDCIFVSTESGFQKYTHTDNTASCFVYPVS